MTHTDTDIDAVVAGVCRAIVDLEASIGKLDRWNAALLELFVESRAAAYVGDGLRRVRPVSIEDLGIYDAEEKGLLSRDEVLALASVDVLVRGEGPTASEGGATVVAIEVSTTLDLADVARVARVADLLNRTGLPARAAVAGHNIPEEVRRFADEHGVLVKIVPPSELPR
ncbi:MAG: hypothetical protein ACRDHF_09695 [Tepidiformaceae bacterium]